MEEEADLDHAAQRVVTGMVLQRKKATTFVDNLSRLHSLLTGHVPSAYHTA